MYIEPNTNMNLLKGVPLDNSYRNTIYFDTLSEQTTYFTSKAKFRLVEYSYQRHSKGKCRISKKAEDVFDCNYIMFQNESFGSKWFYAFITNVEYVNDITCEITFEIDVMQTWFFNYTLKQCFVEREHTVTDEIGDNIVPENIELGEYVYGTSREIFPTLSTYYAIVCVCDTDSAYARRIDNNYIGSRLYAYLVEPEIEYNAFLEKIREYINKPDSIIMIYMCPSLFINGSDIDNTTHEIKHNTKSKSLTVELLKINENATFGNYTPKNAKLYTYPYSYLSVHNAEGESLPLRYEFFNGKPTVEVSGTILPPVQSTVRPINYKGYTDIVGEGHALMTEQLTISNYPLCSWSSDAFKQWFAQNSVPTALNYGMIAISLGMGYNSGNANVIKNGVNNILNETKNLISDGYQASLRSDICRGNIRCGNVNHANKRNTFYYSWVHITEQYCKIIDEFFTMYGYQTNRVKVPNRKARDYWSYVKTNGCNIIPQMPTDDAKKICDIYDNGITFWTKGDYVGNYSLDNSAIDKTVETN